MIRKTATGFALLAVTAAAVGQVQWSVPVSISDMAQSGTHHDTTPKVAVGPDGTLAVAWINQFALGTSATLSRLSNVHITYSQNSGETWTDAALLSNPAYYNGEVDIASGADGEFLFAWSSGDYFSEYRLHTAKTEDTGTTYVFETITGQKSAAEHDHIAPRVAIAGGSQLLSKSSVEVANNLLNINGFLWTKISPASAWSESGVADSPAASHNYKTMAADLAVDPNGKAVAVFQREYFGQTYHYRLLAMTSDDSGATWTNRDHFTPISYRLAEASVATDGNGTWMVAATPMPQQNSLQPLVIYKSTDSGASWIESGSLTPAVNTVNHLTFPSVATDGNGNWLIVMHGFHDGGTTSNYSTDGDILYSISSDNGNTWSALAAVNDSPASDVALDTAPQAAYLGGGKWGVFWARSENGTDSDIVLATTSESSASVSDWQLF